MINAPHVEIDSIFIDEFLQHHEEAIVIYLDRDPDFLDEYIVNAVAKLANNKSKLSSVLEFILENLQKTKNGKRNSPPNKTTSLSEKSCNKNFKNCTCGY